MGVLYSKFNLNFKLSRNQRHGANLYPGRRTFMSWLPIVFLVDNVINRESATLSGSFDSVEKQRLRSLAK